MTKLSVAARINADAYQKRNALAVEDDRIRGAFAALGYDVEIWRSGEAREVHIFTRGDPRGRQYVVGFNPRLFPVEQVAKLLEGLKD